MKGILKMKNWIVILLIFALPLSLYGFLQSDFGQNVIAKEKMSLNTLEIITSPTLYKFSSPMCGECVKAGKIIEEIKGNYPDVEIKEITVTGSEGSKREVKKLLKQYNVTVVPTLIFLDEEANVIKRLEVDMTGNEIKESFKLISRKK